MSVEVNTRQDLYRKFQRRIKGTQENLEEDLELEHEQNMLKTFIIESNVSPDDFLENSKHFRRVREIEPDLFELESEKDEKHVFYLDVQEDRFWSLYTLISSQPANQHIRRATTTDKNGLDRLWIPNSTQSKFLEFGTFKGAGLKQRGKKAFPDDFVNVSDMRLELDGDDAEDFYAIFKQEANIDKVLSLSRIILRNEQGEDYVTERITNSGAFTARGGNNIHIHLKTVEKVKKKYREVIEAIESHHRLSYGETKHGVEVEGKHLPIKLENKIKDIDTFVSHLVDASAPFRLIGPTTEIGQDYRKVRAVDLHNGDKVTLEIESEEIRIYLDNEACGNTALRIFTNIQQYFDPSAVLKVKGFDDV
ncbi:hypothetical protein [Haloarcula rubripromontorii]|uniref:hypothetical protein n=1 Tax=Haloarcula rubripromontorii TaxID=1705562 RepID=UPI00345B7C9E